MLGLLGLRIFEATSADISDLGEEHGHRVLRVCGKGGKSCGYAAAPTAGRDSGNPDRPDSSSYDPAHSLCFMFVSR